MIAEEEITEEEITAHVVYVATREENAHHVTRGLLASLQAGATLTLVERIELRRWLVSVADNYDRDTHDHQLCVGAAKSGRARHMGSVAMRLLRSHAIWSAWKVRDLSWIEIDWTLGQNEEEKKGAAES